MIDNKKFLKDNLRLIEIETFSYCNRKCWFCPNSFVDRRSFNEEMPEDKYLHVLSQLKEIEYDGEVTYSRYNEPLAHKDLIIKRIKQARQMLPSATLRTNTNGDYVTRAYIEELADAGLDQLWIQQYLGNNEKYNHQKVKKRMLKKVKEIGIPYTVLIDLEGCKIEYDLSHRGMTIHIRARNFELDGSSRGDTVPLAKGYTRTQRCLQVSQNMYIDYNGKVMVCCALRSDVPGQESGVMGDAFQNNIWDIYGSSNYDSWRAHHAADGPKKGFCKRCKDSVEPEYMVQIGKTKE